MSNENSIKIILLGESGVGKTNLINVALDKGFDPKSITSAHSSFLQGILDYNNKQYSYALWDTAGQEIYRSLNKIFIKGSKIIIFVYSIESKESFNQIEFWINNAKETLGEGKYIMAILGNKRDLFEEQVVPDVDAKNLAQKWNMKLVITSALADQEGIKNYIRELIIDYINLIGPEEEKNLSIKLRKPSEDNKKKTKFC